MMQSILELRHLRTLLAFPMFATVVWLVWVIGQQAGIDGAAAPPTPAMPTAVEASA